MLTADATYTLQEGTKNTHDAAATLTVTALFNKADDAYTCYVQAIYNDTAEGGIIFTFTKSRLTAFTSAGADDVLKAFNLCEQAVKDELEGLAENSGVTFTIS
jgi:hypothetical protein